jgi:exopolysaccharide production protein ExoQ
LDSGGTANPTISITDSQPTESRYDLPHFLFLGVCFFLVIHDPAASLKAGDTSADLYAATAGHGTLSRQIAFALLGLYGVFGIRDWARSRLRARNAGSVFAFALLGWALISIVWSEAPSASVARLFGLVALTLAALRMRLRFTPRQVVLWVTSTTMVFMTVGILCEIFYGNFHPLTFGYRFYGTLSPNEEGVNCSIAAIGCFWLRRTTLRPKLWTICLVFALSGILMTKSQTSMVAITLSLLIALFVSWKSWKKRTLLISVLAMVAIASYAVQLNSVGPSSDALNLGRDESISDRGSLTGRIPLWNELLTFGREHRIAGFGFGGFWTTERVLILSEDQGWGVSGSHSSYVDMLISLGGVGLVLFCGLVFSGAWTGMKEFSDNGGVGPAFFSSMFLFMIVDGLTDAESVNVSAFLCFNLLLAVMYVMFAKFLGEEPAADVAQRALALPSALV